MKDSNGLYYYPFPGNKRVRMYVRMENDDICFRMWHQDDPKLWEEHGWVPYHAILKATEIYQGSNFDPNAAYDVDLAMELIKKG